MKTSLAIGLLFCFSSSFSQKKNTSISTCESNPGDIIINEIFANPNHQIALPTTEFIELKNNTNQTISLKGWTYSTTNTRSIFKKDSIRANEYLIVCAQKHIDEFKSYERVIGLSTWPRLNNSGDLLVLKNECDTIISQVQYKNTWYRDSQKTAAGRSLECIHPKSICAGIQNWNVSQDVTGGTPGKQNSIYSITLTPLKIMQARLRNETSIILSFNHAIDEASASVVAHYKINNGIGQPEFATPITPYEQVILTLKHPIIRGNTYQITALNIRDCMGNKISDQHNSTELILIKPIAKGDILINEILFNPHQSGVDFIELYNNSAHSLDLKELSFISTKKNGLPQLYPITKETNLLRPSHYLVLSTNPDKIKQQYHTENSDAFLTVENLPPFNNNTSTVILISDSTHIDQFEYAEDNHFELVKNRKGVSLERSSFSRLTNEPGNFRSAAASVGFATPGYKNSQYTDSSISNESFSLVSKTFSPDDDGFEDLMQIQYKFPEPPGVASIDIYSERGVLVKKLIRNQTLATEGIIYWDGTNDQNKRSTVGIYIIHTQIFDPKGNIKRYRQVCALATKLD